MAVIPFLFFLSGATALAAEVVLNRLLTYVFGASHLATATVLAAYMCGLSTGAFVFGRLTIRMRRPIRVYGILELSVAVFLALIPAVFPPFWESSLEWASSWAGQPATLTLLRFGLSFTLVLVPTVLMGGTLPTLLAGFGGREVLSRYLPLLYAVNTLGGASGVLAGGYLLIFRYGLDGTLYLCALMNATVAAVSLLLSLRLERDRCISKTAVVHHAPEGRAVQTAVWTLAPGAVCLLAFMQGGLAFTLEVLWSHLLRTVIGITTYAFSNMLAAILMGIGLGSLLLSRLTKRLRYPPLTYFFLAQLLLALSALGGLYFWDRFPQVVQFTRLLKYDWSFVEREAVRFVFSLLLLLPATLALGVSLPALTASVRTSPDSIGRHKPSAFVGLVFAANTLGAIAGSLLCGFVLLGRVRSDRILVACGAAALMLAAAALIGGRSEGRFHRPRISGWPTFGVTAALGVVLFLFFPGWELSRLTSGSHYYWDFYSRARPDELLFLQEDAQSGLITVERRPNGTKVMKTNGKYEGTDSPAEFQQNFALIGALYLKRFETCALVGLGPGRTLALLHDMPFERIDVVEQSPAIVAAARREFPGFVGEVLPDHDRVRLFIDDGRNYLQLQQTDFDYIAVGITGAAFAGVGSLYNRDFFRVIHSRLNPHGVFMLWIQVHHVLPSDVRSVIYTLRQVFPFVHFYSDGTQGYLAASSSPLSINPESVERLADGPRIRLLLEETGMHSLLELVAMSVFTTDDELEGYFRSGGLGEPPVLYTDFNPRFEYTSPMGAATSINYFDFSPYSAARLPELQPPVAEGERAGLLGLRLLAADRQEEALEQFLRAQRSLNRPVWEKRIEELESALQLR